MSVSAPPSVVSTSYSPAADSRRGSIARLTGRVALAAGVLLALEALPDALGRQKLSLLVAAVVLGLVVAWRWRAVTAMRAVGPVLALGALSVVIVALAAVAQDEHPRLFDLARNLVPTLAGWSAALLLLSPEEAERRSDAWRGWHPTRGHVALLLGATAIVLGVAHVVAVGPWAVINDEVLYLLEGRWLGQPRLSWNVDPAIADFFKMRKVGIIDGRVFGMYTPGWPSILALFDAVGVRSLANVVLGAASVWLTFTVGRRLIGDAGGYLAAGLLASSQLFIVWHAGYMSHGATIFCTLAGTLLLLVGDDARGARRTLAWSGAGLMLGYCVTVRPLTGVTIGATVVLWVLIRRRRSLGEAAHLAASLVLGGVLPAAWLLYYNWATHGEPLKIGYQALHGALYDLGFGTRGFMVYDERLNLVPQGFEFTPRRAMDTLLLRLASANYAFLQAALLFPVLALGVAHGQRMPWRTIAVFALLPVAHFFYWGTELRFYAELLPFVLIGVAAILLTIASRHRELATGLVALVGISSVIVALPSRNESTRLQSAWRSSAYVANPGRLANFAYADSLARAHGKVLLFTRESSVYDTLIDRLYLFNEDGFDGRVLVARDRGAANVELARRFPDRTPYLVADRGRLERAEFTRLSLSK